MLGPSPLPQHWGARSPSTRMTWLCLVHPVCSFRRTMSIYEISFNDFFWSCDLQLKYKISSPQNHKVRYGKGEGFSNKEKAKVHSASVKFQQQTYVSIHENVPPYEQDWQVCFSTYLHGILLLFVLLNPKDPIRNHCKLSELSEWNSCHVTSCRNSCKNISPDTRFNVPWAVLSLAPVNSFEFQRHVPDSKVGPSNVWSSQHAAESLENLLPQRTSNMVLQAQLWRSCKTPITRSPVGLEIGLHSLLQKNPGVRTCWWTWLDWAPFLLVL